MANELAAAPALSTPAEHLFEHIEADAPPTESQLLHRTDDELRDVYEIARTAKEIREGGRRRIGLQFPDTMLGDAPRVVGLLHDEFRRFRSGTATGPTEAAAAPATEAERIYILADTSYSACCVDEIAAEHVHADVVVHYGRSCLSPTSRLPVIYVFTKHPLDHERVIEEFLALYPKQDEAIVLMADVTYQDHVPELASKLRTKGYASLLHTKLVHAPTATIPNRGAVDADGKDVEAGEGSGVDLQDYSVFHISAPPTALLLALSTRVKSLQICPTPAASGASSEPPASFQRTRAMLGRRYAKVLTLTTAGVVGILVNTLSVANYLASIDSLRRRIAAAGKKSYTIVVGKLNPAKLANFAEIDGWVVVGCWESSLVEDDASFYRPVITPFELEIALMSDEERIWGHRWWGGIEGVTEPEEAAATTTTANGDHSPGQDSHEQEAPADQEDGIHEEESEAPQFDLRTGKLISTSRPMRMMQSESAGGNVPNGASVETPSNKLTLRPKFDVATVKGVVSPGAEYLRSNRTWQGLGTDYDDESSATIEEGRSGVARGYTVGSDADKR